MREFKEFLNQPGLITLLNWIIMPDGDEYKYIWCSSWKIITDKQFPLDNFRSSEKWQLLGLRGKQVVCVIPGCQVAGWIMCKKPPITIKLYRF